MLKVVYKQGDKLTLRGDKFHFKMGCYGEMTKYRFEVRRCKPYKVFFRGHLMKTSKRPFQCTPGESELRPAGREMLRV